MTKPLKLDDLAKAIQENHLAISDGYYTHAARAILTTIKEAGWKIVPVEATEEMIAEAISDYIGDIDATLTWQAMQSAAPKIEGE